MDYLKANLTGHRFLTGVGVVCFLVACAELLLLWRTPAYGAMALAAVTASAWFTERMDVHCFETKRRIQAIEGLQRRVQEHYDQLEFESALARTRARYQQEQRATAKRNRKKAA